MGEDVDEAIQLSVNSAVECLRAAQYVMDPDPLNFKFAADFDALSAAEPPPSDGQWKGLRFYVNERMCETAAFANNVVSIKKTKVNWAKRFLLDLSRGRARGSGTGGPESDGWAGWISVGWW
eukprot:7691445-Pyramimonas_sp.AAC.1